MGNNIQRPEIKYVQISKVYNVQFDRVTQYSHFNKLHKLEKDMPK